MGLFNIGWVRFCLIRGFFMTGVGDHGRGVLTHCLSDRVGGVLSLCTDHRFDPFVSMLTQGLGSHLGSAVCGCNSQGYLRAGG